MSQLLRLCNRGGPNASDLTPRADRGGLQGQGSVRMSTQRVDISTRAALSSGPSRWLGICTCLCLLNRGVAMGSLAASTSSGRWMKCVNHARSRTLVTPIGVWAASCKPDWCSTSFWLGHSELPFSISPSPRCAADPAFRHYAAAVLRVNFSRPAVPSYLFSQWCDCSGPSTPNSPESE